MKWKLILGITVLLISALVFTCGMVMSLWLLDDLFEKGVANGLIIDGPGDSSSYQAWVYSNCSDCAPYYQNVYMWNMTNWRAVQEGGVPVFELVGPYSYLQYKEKFNIVWQDDGKQVTYSELKQYYWSANTSGAGLSENDVIINLNPLYLGAMNRVGGEANLNLLVTNMTLNLMTNLLTTLFPGLIMEKGVSQQMDGGWNNLPSYNATDFYSTWANATTPPDSQWTNWIVSTTGTPSGISMASAVMLWDPTFLYSMRNGSTTASGLWGQADAYSPTAAQQIQALFSLTPQQYAALMTWRQFWVTAVTTNLLTTFKVTQLSDLGYVQWGTGAVTGGISVSVLDPSLGITFPPEIAIFAEQQFNLTFSLDFATSKSLLSTQTPAGLLDMTDLGTFLALADAGQWGQIQALFNLSQSQAQVVQAYLLAIPKAILTPVFAAGGGLITQRTVRGWLWQGTDPLFMLLNVPKNTGLLTNDTSYDASVASRKNSTFYTGKGDIDLIWEMRLWMTNETVDIYSEPITVTGTTGNSFAPFVDQTQTLEVMSEDLYRPIDMIFTNYSTVRDIPTWRFMLSPVALQPDPIYFQPVMGFANLSGAYEGSPIFLSKPEMLDADQTYIKKIVGMSPNETEDDTWLDLDPITGYVIHAYKRLQLNLYLNNTAYFTKYNEDVQQDTFYPLFYVEQTSTLSDQQAYDLRHDVLDVKDKIDTGKVASFWMGIGVGIGGLLIGGFFVASYVITKRREGYRTLDG